LAPSWRAGPASRIIGSHAYLSAQPTTFSTTVPIQDSGGFQDIVKGTARMGGGDISVGSDAGRPSLVTVFDPEHKSRWITIQPYESAFRTGVRVASGTLFGQPIVVTAPGPGHSPRIEIFNRSTGQLMTSFLPMPAPGLDIPHGFTQCAAASFTGGMYVALGDVNSEGIPDLIVAQDAGDTDKVEVSDGRFLNSTLALIGQPFQAFGGRYGAGVRVAANGGDLVLVNGPGAPPRELPAWLSNKEGLWPQSRGTGNLPASQIESHTSSPTAGMKPAPHATCPSAESRPGRRHGPGPRTVLADKSLKFLVRRARGFRMMG
jgi:hypothetical protein